MSAYACNYIDAVYNLYEYNTIGANEQPTNLDSLLQVVLEDIDIFDQEQQILNTTCSVISITDAFCTPISIIDLTPNN